MPPIGVVQSADSARAQALFAGFVALWRDRLCMTGVIEYPQGHAGKLARGGLLRVVGGAYAPGFALFGAQPTTASGCTVMPEGAVQAAALIEARIGPDTDLVILNKFGKLEAGRSGLLSAFGAAMLAQVPVLTFVSPRYAAEWDRFAAPLYAPVAPTLAAIEAWWCAQAQALRV